MELDGNRFLRATSRNAALSIDLGESLPPRFTIEMDVYNAGAPYGMALGFNRLPNERNGLRGQAYVQWAAPARAGSGFISAEGTSNALQRVDESFRKPVRFRVMVDGQHLKLYADYQRLANVPTAGLERSQQVHLLFDGSSEAPIYVGNVRVAAGGRDLYDVLERGGPLHGRRSGIRHGERSAAARVGGRLG